MRDVIDDSDDDALLDEFEEKVDEDDLDDRAEALLEAVVERDDTDVGDAVPTILDTVSVTVAKKDGGTVVRADNVTDILGEREALLLFDSRAEAVGDVEALALSVSDPEADGESEDDEDSLLD